MSPVKSLEVTVQGFPPMVFTGATASKAFVGAWRQYCHAYQCTFGHFMTIAKRRAVPNAAGVGEPIRVNGRKAWTMEPRQHSTAFIYDGEDDVMVAHHTEIENGH
ncbi:MAG: hypothetical protein AAFX52_11020 [Pseudomonadota bacterium]